MNEFNLLCVGCNHKHDCLTTASKRNIYTKSSVYLPVFYSKIEILFLSLARSPDLPALQLAARALDGQADYTAGKNAHNPKVSAPLEPFHLPSTTSYNSLLLFQFLNRLFYPQENCSNFLSK